MKLMVIGYKKSVIFHTCLSWTHLREASPSKQKNIYQEQFIFNFITKIEHFISSSRKMLWIASENERKSSHYIYRPSKKFSMQSYFFFKFRPPSIKQYSYKDHVYDTFTLHFLNHHYLDHSSSTWIHLRWAKKIFCRYFNTSFRRLENCR